MKDFEYSSRLEVGIPTLEGARIILKEAEVLNPGPWVTHSENTAEAAKIIAENAGLDGEKAYILGLLHDIGRRVGVTSMRHSIDGYNFCSGLGFNTCGRISLTHSLPTKNMKEVFGKWDCDEKEYEFIEKFIETVEYDDYDRLIQLCDALALPEGFVLMEKRMLDVALRHGVHEYTISKWKKTFEIKAYFENLMGKSIYSILPGVVENTFEGGV